MHISIANGFIPSKIYDIKRDDWDFDIVNFPFLDDDAPRSASYGVYISQLIRLLESAIILRASTGEINVQRPNFSSRAIGIINLEKTFSKFYRRHGVDFQI